MQRRTPLKRAPRFAVPRDLAVSVLCTVVGSMVVLCLLLATFFTALDRNSRESEGLRDDVVVDGGGHSANAAHGDTAPASKAAKAKAAVVRHTKSVLQPRVTTPYTLRRLKTHDALASCVTPFGTRLGIADGVPAYSNCNTRFRSQYVNHLNRRDPLAVDAPYDPADVSMYFMTAERYLALDFVQRWLILQRGVALPLVEYMRDLWRRAFFTNPSRPGSMWDAVYLDNGVAAVTRDDRAYTAPRRGDVVVFDVTTDRFPGLGYGHVAVVVKVEDDVDAVAKMRTGNNNDDKDNTDAAATTAARLRKLRRRRLQPRRVYIAEQNLYNTDWQGRNYSRVLSFYWEQLGDDVADDDDDDNNDNDNNKATSSPPRAVLVDPDGLFVVGRIRIGTMRTHSHDEDDYERGLQHRYTATQDEAL